MKNQKEKIKIIIADDHQLVRRGLKQTLEAEKDIAVIAEARDGQEAFEKISDREPDVAILDVDMPKMDGLEVARKIGEEKIPVKIIFLTIHSEEVLFHHALDLGALGYVLKESAADDIVAAVRKVIRGKYFTSLSMTGYLLTRGESKTSLEKPRNTLLDKLTPTELRILKMLAEYKTNKEIANELGVSHRTIETHRSNMCQKLDLHGSHALVKFAGKHRRQI